MGFKNWLRYPEFEVIAESPAKDLALNQAARKLKMPIDEITDLDLRFFIYEDWLKTSDAAVRLGITTHTLMYHARKRGRMIFVQFPPFGFYSYRIYFEPKSVDQFAKLPRSPGRKVRAS